MLHQLRYPAPAAPLGPPSRGSGRGVTFVSGIPPLERAVRRALGAMFYRGSFLGVQVCVIVDGVKLVDVAAGELGALNPRPVRPNTLFPCLGVSRTATVALLHRLATLGLVQYDQVRRLCRLT